MPSGSGREVCVVDVGGRGWKGGAGWERRGGAGIEPVGWVCGVGERLEFLGPSGWLNGVGRSAL